MSSMRVRGAYWRCSVMSSVVVSVGAVMVVDLRTVWARVNKLDNKSRGNIWVNCRKFYKRVALFL